MARKTKKARRREERERKEVAERELAEAREKRTRTYRIALIAVPMVTLVVSLGVYFGIDNRQLAGLLGMVGIAIWVLTGLSFVGGNVTPRDRTRAGSIDFGNKR
ncbi:MAG: hypothetical protein AB8I08_04850 [Sandaracinaceae bacterium]